MAEKQKNKKIKVIVGPTCVGKTSLALDICKKYGGEIISADSRQIYRYMDIGTGKLPIHKHADVKKNDYVWNLAGVNIWGYDLTTPDNYFSGYDFALFALNKIRELDDTGKHIFIVGGTGFFTDLITGKIVPSNIKPDFALRNELEQLPNELLADKIKKLNPAVFASIDKNNRVRLVRALERELLKNNPEKESVSLPYLSEVSYEYYGLTAPNEILFGNADKWADSIWNLGLVGEVKNLINLGYDKSPKLNGLIYKSVVQYLAGVLGEREAVQRIKYDLHAYIRRQLTWFKKNKRIKWYDVSVFPREKIIEDIVKI